MNKQKSVMENKNDDDGIVDEGGVNSTSDNNIQQLINNNNNNNNNAYHQHRQLVLQNQSNQNKSSQFKLQSDNNYYFYQDEGLSSSNQHVSQDLIVDNDNDKQIHTFQQLNQTLVFASPKKNMEHKHLASQDNHLVSQDNHPISEVFYIPKNNRSNVNGIKGSNQSRNKTPYQRIYVEQQSIHRSQNNQSNGIGNSSNQQNQQNNTSLTQVNNAQKYDQIGRRDLTPKSKISIGEDNQQGFKSNNKRSAMRDMSNEGYHKNTDEYKITIHNKVNGDITTGKQQAGQHIKEQLTNMMQQQNSSFLKKVIVGRHNSQISPFTSNHQQDTSAYNQSFNIRQIKKKSSVSMGDSQLIGNVGSAGLAAAANGQNSQLFGQNNYKNGERDGSNGNQIGQNSICKYDSIKNMQQSQDNSAHNISVYNQRNISQMHPDSQLFQVSIYNNQERQDRIKEAYLGTKTNHINKKHTSPPKEIIHSQYETIDTHKRKAKSTQRQQSILRERRQNGNTIHFIQLNQSGGSGGNTNSNKNLSLYSLNQNNNNTNNTIQNNGSAYDSCYASQNANRFYFRSKNNQNGTNTQHTSGITSNQVQSSMVGSQITTSAAAAAPSSSVARRQLPHIRDAYNTIDANNGNNSTGAAPSAYYKAKNIVKLSGNAERQNFVNRTLDAQSLSTTSKQDKANKLVSATINSNMERKQNSNNSHSYYDSNCHNNSLSNNSNKNKMYNNRKVQTIEQPNKTIFNTHDNHEINTSKTNSRFQSIRRGRFQNTQNTQNTANIQQPSQNRIISQKENMPIFLQQSQQQQQQQQQQQIIQATLQLQSCTNNDDTLNQNEIQRVQQTNSQSQGNNALNLTDIVDVPVVQKQDKLLRFQENLQRGDKQKDDRKLKNYALISIEEQKRCASQTENRPESQIQKDKQNYYKQSCGVDKIQQLKQIDTGDIVPAKMTIDRNQLNPIHSPMLNRDSSPVPQAHTPTKKRIKNHYSVNQKIEFFPQPPPPQSQNIQQQPNQAKGTKYGQIIQKFQRGNIVKPKNNMQTHHQQQHLNVNMYQQNNHESNHYQSTSTNPNSVGPLNKQGSQMSTNIALSSNQCQDIHELKFNSHNEGINHISQNGDDIVEPDESMDNLMRSFQDDVYQEIKHQTTNQKESGNTCTHIQSLENSFANYFTLSHIALKSQNENENKIKKQVLVFGGDTDFEVKEVHSSSPQEMKQITKITEKNEDIISAKVVKNSHPKDDFIFSRLDALHKDNQGSKAKIIIDFDIDDDDNCDFVLTSHDKTSNLNQQNKPSHIDAHTQNLDNSQSLQENMIEEPIDNGRNSPQISKPSSLKPLYYKYNNSYHQISHDNLEQQDIDLSQQPPFQKYHKNKISNLRNSYLKQSIRYDNNFFNQLQP